MGGDGMGQWSYPLNLMTISNANNNDGLISWPSPKVIGDGSVPFYLRRPQSRIRINQRAHIGFCGRYGFGYRYRLTNTLSSSSSLKGVLRVVALPRGCLLQSLSRNQSQGHHFPPFHHVLCTIGQVLEKTGNRWKAQDSFFRSSIVVVLRNIKNLQSYII